MKTTSRLLAFLVILTLSLSSFSGCSLAGEGEAEVIAESVQTAIAEAGSVEASIFLNIQAATSNSSSTGDHTASVEADITVLSTFAPYAYHSEAFSKILVDSITTREDAELYVVPAENGIDYHQYEYNAANDSWSRKTLTRAEEQALSLKTCLPRNWTSFFNAITLDREDVEINSKVTNQYTGTIDSIILQEILNDGIFGSFLYNVEQLLLEGVYCTLYLEQETNLPVQLIVDFREGLNESNMSFNNATITVDYTDWGATSEISVPKKVSVVATDTQEAFYSSYYAWNLFLPYLKAATDTGTGDAAQNENFMASWNNFQIRIDNGLTSLPVPYEDLAKMGYSIDDYHKSDVIEPNKYVVNIPIYKGQDLIYCSIYNDTTAPLPITNCKIGSISIASADQEYDSISIFLPGNVQLGVTKDFVISTFGDNAEKVSEFASDTYIWRITETENQYLKVEVNPQTNTVIRLQLTYIPVTGGEQ